MFDPQKIHAEIAESGLQRTNKFQLLFALPVGLSNTTVSQQLLSTLRKLELYGESASVPGVAALTHDVRRYGYGPTEKNISSPLFNDWPINLRCDARGRIHDFFRQWIRMMLNFETAGPAGRGTIRDVNGTMQNQYAYETAYKADYAIDMKITTYDDAGAPAIEVVLRDAFPIFVGEMVFDWSRTNEYARLPITLSYTDWSSTATPSIDPRNAG